MRIFQTQKARWTCLSKILKEKSSLFLSLPSLRILRKAIVQPLQGQLNLIWHQTSMMLSIKKLAQEVPVQTGIFGADMQVELVNNGPVTIILDTKRDKKDQAQSAWSFSSIIKYSKRNRFLICLGKSLSGFGRCDRKGWDILGWGEFPEGKVEYHLKTPRRESSGYPIGEFVKQNARISV